MKKRILVLGYSQSGQLNRLLDSILAPLAGAEEIEVHRRNLEPVEPFPFPWPFLQFFNTFPECVYETPVPLEPLSVPTSERYDLIILAYQVWFLSPSLPVTSFLQTEAAAHLFRDTPVITVIGCRNMWLMAQEKVKARLKQLGARLIDNIVLTDYAHSAMTFVATPIWVLTGNKGPFLGGLIPRAGISEEDIAAASRFGQAIAAQLPHQSGEPRPMLAGLGAVSVNERLIASEQIAHRSFRIWGRLLRAIGPQQSVLRKCVLVLYVLFLVMMILTVVPLSALLKRLFAPLLSRRTAAQKLYFAAPSGEATDRLN
ncbi:dialkylresorcinol condensing enzyme [Gilvimarinus sp. F26214L]|uniref:dialkylrecorsinol condensing enzyme n=1 Tax=Gilvimarinus sp. DZF01 TaxID=3461371 RepID=UPI0040453D28